jgi:hypothetical protein
MTNDDAGGAFTMTDPTVTGVALVGTTQVSVYWLEFPGVWLDICQVTA